MGVEDDQQAGACRVKRPLQRKRQFLKVARPLQARPARLRQDILKRGVPVPVAVNAIPPDDDM